MGLGLLRRSENACRLDNIVGSSIFPWDVGRVSLGIELDRLSVHNQIVPLDFDFSIEFAMLGIIFKHVCLDGYKISPMPQILIPVLSQDERQNALHESGTLTAYLASIKGSLTATTLTLPRVTLLTQKK